VEKNEHVRYWRESAEHDLESAKSMFDSGRYDWCLFVGHLSLEKLLKAIFVERNNNDQPPRMHNLVRLSELCNIDLNEEKKLLLDKINDFNIQARYPDYKFEFYKKCDKEFTGEYFGKIKELFEWFKSLLM
jgi:HEPN domain-containing protein